MDEIRENPSAVVIRLCRFYPNYSEAETSEQYDKCLKSNRGGVTLKTFFWLAGNAGIGNESETEEMEESETPMPTFPFGRNPKNPKNPKNNSNPKVCDFPVFLQKVMEVAETDEERDLLLLGSITTLSACLGRIYGIYDGRRVYPNLFLFVTARASAGKGRLMLCKKLVLKVHRVLRQEAENLQERYQQELCEYNDQKGKKNASDRPRKPPELMLFIPANSSTTGFFQLLADNNGKGLVMETEGDTLSLTFKTDYGNYSDGFRKAFHHETISYFRRTDKEYVDIDTPRVSAVLSGTPNQVGNLIHSSENGLFSRFMFYYMNVNPEWKDVFAPKLDQELDDNFVSLGEEFFQLFERLQGSPDIRFSLGPEQKQRFNAFFKDIQEKYLYLQGLDYLATVRRLGLIFFRICMVLSALRLLEQDKLPPRLECSDTDFDIAAAMIRVLVRHSGRVFSELPEETRPVPRKNKKEEFLEALPVEFNRQAYLEIANNLGINRRNADYYIKSFVKRAFVHREQRDSYKRKRQEDESP
ncbi:MAG: YfjI family protein [Bacteroides sp.]|nr:YfjI family protein [Bacteroides sp.]